MDSTAQDYTLSADFKRKKRCVYAFLGAVALVTAADLVYKYKQGKAAETHPAQTAAPPPASAPLPVPAVENSGPGLP